MVEQLLFIRQASIKSQIFNNNVLFKARKIPHCSHCKIATTLNIIEKKRKKRTKNFSCYFSASNMR